jgi:hypothetical protein
MEEEDGGGDKRPSRGQVRDRGLMRVMARCLVLVGSASRQKILMVWQENWRKRDKRGQHALVETKL